jgi:hypothetical protein
VKSLKAPVVHELADSLVERRWIDAGPNGLAGQRIEITGLQFTITDVLVRVELLDGRTMQTIARPSQPWVEIAASQSRWEAMGTYTVGSPRLGCSSSAGRFARVLDAGRARWVCRRS